MEYNSLVKDSLHNVPSNTYVQKHILFVRKQGNYESVKKMMKDPSKKKSTEKNIQNLKHQL